MTPLDRPSGVMTCEGSGNSRQPGCPELKTADQNRLPPEPPRHVETKAERERRITTLRSQSSELVKTATQLRESAAKANGAASVHEIEQQAKRIEALSRSVTRLLGAEGMVPVAPSNKVAQEKALQMQVDELLAACVALKDNIEANSDGHIDVRSLRAASAIAAMAKAVRANAKRTLQAAK